MDRWNSSINAGRNTPASRQRRRWGLDGRKHFTLKTSTVMVTRGLPHYVVENQSRMKFASVLGVLANTVGLSIVQCHFAMSKETSSGGTGPQPISRIASGRKREFKSRI